MQLHIRLKAHSTIDIPNRLIAVAVRDPTASSTLTLSLSLFHSRWWRSVVIGVVIITSILFSFPPSPHWLLGFIVSVCTGRKTFWFQRIFCNARGTFAWKYKVQPRFFKWWNLMVWLDWFFQVWSGPLGRVSFSFKWNWISMLSLLWISHRLIRT